MTISITIVLYILRQGAPKVILDNKLFPSRVVSAVSTDTCIVSSQLQNTAVSHMVSQDSRIHYMVQMNEWPLILLGFNCISTKEWNETRPYHLCLKSTNGDFSVGFTDI